MSQALSQVLAQAANAVHIVCLCLRRLRTMWISLRVLKALVRCASDDVSCDPSFPRNRRLCGRESAIYHISTVVSAIVQGF